MKVWDFQISQALNLPGGNPTTCGPCDPNVGPLVVTDCQMTPIPPERTVGTSRTASRSEIYWLIYLPLWCTCGINNVVCETLNVPEDWPHSSNLSKWGTVFRFFHHCWKKLVNSSKNSVNVTSGLDILNVLHKGIISNIFKLCSCWVSEAGLDWVLLLQFLWHPPGIVLQVQETSPS